MRRIVNTCLIAFSLVISNLATAPAVFADQTDSSTGAGSAAVHRPKVGLALGGGGSRGAAHVRVLKVLEKEGIPIDYIAGTSIGSVVGGLYAAGMPLDELEKQFADVNLMHSFMTVPLWVRLAVAPIMVIPRLWEHPYDGLYKGNKFRKFLENDVPEHSLKNIEDLKIPYSAVATNLVDGQPHRISKGELGYAMQASCAVPGLRKPVEINGNLYCDGGVSSNVPVKMVREMGADIVIAVDIDERMDQVPISTFRKIGSVSERLIKLQLANLDTTECAGADIVIHPNVDGIGLISTRKEDALRGLKAGEEAAEAAIPEIKKKLKAAGVSLAGMAATH